MDDTYKKQIEDAFNKWDEAPHFRFRHKNLLYDLIYIRDAYRHDVKGQEKPLAKFEREVKRVASEHGITYNAETRFARLNDYLELGYHPENLCEARIGMRFPDGIVEGFEYYRDEKKFNDAEYYPDFVASLGDQQVGDLAAYDLGIAPLGSPKTLSGRPQKVVESLILNRANSPVHPWKKEPFGKTPDGSDYHLSYNDYCGWGAAFYNLCCVDASRNQNFALAVETCLDEQAKETYGKPFLPVTDEIPDYLQKLAEIDSSIVAKSFHIQDVQQQAREAIAAAGLDIPDHIVNVMVEEANTKSTWRKEVVWTPIPESEFEL